MQLVQGYCVKHKTPEGNPMPKVDRGGESVCMFCESETSPKTGINAHVDDPGDEQVRAVLKKAGIAVPPSTGKAPMPDVPKPIRHPGVAEAVKTQAQIDAAMAKQIADVTLVSPKNNFASRVELALGIMKSLPMPSDVKQFKAIQKVIAGMESLLGEK